MILNGSVVLCGFFYIQHKEGFVMEQNRNCGNNGFEMYNIGDRCEYVQYAIEIERTLHNMQKE